MKHNNLITYAVCKIKQKNNYII